MTIQAQVIVISKNMPEWNYYNPDGNTVVDWCMAVTYTGYIHSCSCGKPQNTTYISAWQHRKTRKDNKKIYKHPNHFLSVTVSM